MLVCNESDPINTFGTCFNQITLNKINLHCSFRLVWLLPIFRMLASPCLMSLHLKLARSPAGYLKIHWFITLLDSVQTPCVPLCPLLFGPLWLLCRLLADPIPGNLPGNSSLETSPGLLIICIDRCWIRSHLMWWRSIWWSYPLKTWFPVAMFVYWSILGI